MAIGLCTGIGWWLPAGITALSVLVVLLFFKWIGKNVMYRWIPKIKTSVAVIRVEVEMHTTLEQQNRIVQALSSNCENLEIASLQFEKTGHKNGPKLVLVLLLAVLKRWNALSWKTLPFFARGSALSLGKEGKTAAPARRFKEFGCQKNIFLASFEKFFWIEQEYDIGFITRLDSDVPSVKRLLRRNPSLELRQMF